MRCDPTVLQQAEQALGYTFANRDLLDRALTHASISDSRLDSNERLEFLGDAVLGFLVCEFLHAEYPDLLEGDLTKIKSAAVSRRMCAKVATALSLDELLLIGKGMQTRGGLPSSLAAAVFESITGAIYLDGGIEAARAFVISNLAPHIRVAANSGHQQNFKSVLQQHVQIAFKSTPEYVLLDEKGPDHAKCFNVCVQVGDRRFPACWAGSKKQAEQQAALKALEELGRVLRDDEGRILCLPDNEPSISEAV